MREGQGGGGPPDGAEQRPAGYQCGGGSAVRGPGRRDYRPGPEGGEYGDGGLPAAELGAAGSGSGKAALLRRGGAARDVSQRKRGGIGGRYLRLVCRPSDPEPGRLRKKFPG